MTGAAKPSNHQAVVSFTAQHFRDRSRDCLNLSKGARHEEDRTMLEDIAAELSAEAAKIGTEGEVKPEGA